MLSALPAGLQASAASLHSPPHLSGRMLPDRQRCELKRADGIMYRVCQVDEQGPDILRPCDVTVSQML